MPPTKLSANWVELGSGVNSPSPIAPNTVMEDALELAREAHQGSRTRGDTDLDHPLQVARLLEQAGYDDDVVAAGLLHDVVEDSSIGLDEIESRCGPEVRRLVSAMTEDSTIDPWASRKAEHRQRIANHDRVAGAIYAADKLAKVRAAAATGDVPAPRKLRHYRRSVQTLGRAFPGLPFLEQLRTELEDLISSRAR
jgi:(p)ppGpp synthase/HD superfamily hydrolase